MPKTYKQYLGVIIIIGGLILLTYLAIQKEISETLYGLSIVVFIAAGFLIYKIDDIIEFETKWLKLKTLQKEVYARVEEVQKLARELDKDKKELREATKIFIESFYLTLQTRNVFPIPDHVVKILEKNLNALSGFAVENPTEREGWIHNIGQILKSSKNNGT